MNDDVNNETRRLLLQARFGEGISCCQQFHIVVILSYTMRRQPFTFTFRQGDNESFTKALLFWYIYLKWWNFGGRSYQGYVHFSQLVHWCETILSNGKLILKLCSLLYVYIYIKIRMTVMVAHSLIVIVFLTATLHVLLLQLCKWCSSINARFVLMKFYVG